MYSKDIDEKRVYTFFWATLYVFLNSRRYVTLNRISKGQQRTFSYPYVGTANKIV